MPRFTYQLEIRHPGLHEFKIVKGYTAHEAEAKARAQMAKWEEKWQRQQDRLIAAQTKEQRKDLATYRTEEANETIREVVDLLISSLAEKHALVWGDLVDNSSFPEMKPVIPQKPLLPIEPLPTDERFQPRLSIVDRVFSSRRQRKIKIAQESFEIAKKKFHDRRNELAKTHKRHIEEYNVAAESWNQRLRAFHSAQQEKNKALEVLRAAYLAKEPHAVSKYCELVLSKSKYPDSFPRIFELEYRSETKILLVSYALPSPENLPVLKEVKYVAARDELVELMLPESAAFKLYDETIYKIALRTIFELFDADQKFQTIEAIVFNGCVDSIDKSTGHEVHACILSVQANRAEFNQINLLQVDPKACIRKLKGVGSSQLHSLTPIAPIMKLDREDSRFVESYEVVDGLNEYTNLAAMDWEDFEHLIRELFEAEFKTYGGEVKVTQASRDGGVDAVAFDPDPIRGGKIVIQAKRYTNVVGVAAVRDLYGTILNEGATKGILVTTSQYGPDAFTFAKDKPITLMDGSNLLHLLQKHGHKARIDLREAKRILNQDKEAI